MSLQECFCLWFICYLSKSFSGFYFTDFSLLFLGLDFFVPVLRQGVKVLVWAGQDKVVVFSSPYACSGKYCSISKAMMVLCVVPMVSPVPLSQMASYRQLMLFFPLQINHVGVLNKKEFPLPWTTATSSLILQVFPHFGPYQLIPTEPRLCLVE